MPDPLPPTMDIATVAQDTGLSKDTLRVWERRYGFPRPLRDAHGERLYPPDQVEKLRLVRRLMDAGHRPGGIVGQPLEHLQKLSRPAAASPLSPDAYALLSALADDDADAVDDQLRGALGRAGLRRYVTEVLPPLIHAVGAAWAAGQIRIRQEHLFTERLTAIVRGALAGLAAKAQARPRVLLTTLPGEPHALGLLLAEAVLTLEGARCIPLGVATPIAEIAAAARALQADVVGLSFSTAHPLSEVRAGLAALRRELPDSIQVWAGGRGGGRRTPPSVTRIHDLQEIAGAVAAWRAATPRIRIP